MHLRNINAFINTYILIYFPIRKLSLEGWKCNLNMLTLKIHPDFATLVINKQKTNKKRQFVNVLKLGI